MRRSQRGWERILEATLRVWTLPWGQWKGRHRKVLSRRATCQKGWNLSFPQDIRTVGAASGPRPGAPEASGQQGEGCPWKQGPGLLVMVGRGGRPWAPHFSVGEREELLVQKAGTAPDPRSGSSVKWKLCLMQVHTQIEGGLHSAFLERHFFQA